MVSVAESDWRRYVRPTVGNQVLWLLCFMYFLYYIDRVNIATAAPLIQADLHLTHTELGAAFGAFAAPYTIFQLIGGWLGDRLGPRRTLGIGGVIVCAATALTGLVGGLQSLSNARLLLGIGEGAAFPTATRAMSGWLPREQWAYAQGITHCFARIGNALTPPLIALLISAIGWRGSFVVMGAVSLVWVAVWVWFFRDDPRQHPAVSDAEIAQMPLERSTTRASLNVENWLRLARRIVPVTAVDFCYGWTLWLFLTWVPSFFYSAYHLDLKHSALFSSGVFLAGVVGDTVGGLVSDRLLARTGNLRVARNRIIALGLFGACVFLVPVVLFHDLGIAVISLSLAFFFAELVVAPIWSVPMDIAPRYAGTASGMMNVGFGLAGVSSPFFFGRLIDLTGTWTYPFLGSIVLLLLGSIMALRLRPDRPFEPVGP